MEIFCERLRELREEKGLSQRQLAIEVDVKNATISRWEKGEREPLASNIIRLSKYFGVSADYLLGLED